MFGIKEKKVMEDYKDGSKKITIDYKRIEEYDKPFVMVLKVQGKRKLDVRAVNNGKEAKAVREKYVRLGRYTSYVAFYNTVEDLIEEQGKEGLQFNPKFRGKNQKSRKPKAADNETYIVKIDKRTRYLVAILREETDLQAYVERLIKEDFVKVITGEQYGNNK